MNINKDIQLHLSHYFVLLIILNIGVGAFLFFHYNTVFQVYILMATSGAYLLWGIIHHWLDNELHLKVIIDYLLIVLLADLFILTLLLRA